MSYQRVNQSVSTCSVGRLILIGMACLLLSGCQGCRSWNPWSKKGKQEEKDDKKERAFRLRPLQPLPTDPGTQGLRPVKAGHVTEFLWTVRANNEDVRADITLSVHDGNVTGQPRKPLSRFELTFHREVALPKGQDKQFRLWYPLPSPPRSKQFAFQSRLQPRHRSKSMNLSRDLATIMPPNQFFLVVLADQPDRFSFLKQLYALRQPPFELAAQEPEVYYQVVLPPADQPYTVPNNPLAWTPIAYVVWDEVAPSKLSGAQQQALLTWLHWGGQLIVSGPNSLSLLKGSFLEPYLPAVSRGTRSLGQAAFTKFNQTWSIPGQSRKGQPEIRITDDAPLAGVDLVLAPGGSFLTGCDELIAEKSVGQGRIVVSAFPLDARPIINWRSYDSFFNACLLRKPPRRFELIEQIQPVWYYLERRRNGWRRSHSTSPNTRVRFFARDASKAAIVGESLDHDPLVWNGTEFDRITGQASWNDGSAAAVAAERILAEAAGISVPKRDFVWKSLTLYLIVLVPVNWVIFRLLGRVEWAWVAAPVIAILGAVWIVQQAQLDIGFVRSRHEVAILELQGPYPRAHLSRFTALYSSLATSFDIRLETPNAVIKPFGEGDERDQRIKSVSLWSDKTTRLTGFHVDSSATAMVHSEEFVDSGGSIVRELQSGLPVIANRTGIQLNGAAVVERSEDGELRGAWVGRLNPGTSKRLQFHALSPISPWFEQWDQLAPSAKSAKAGMKTPSVRALIAVSVRNLPLRPGESRLVGWVEETPPGLTVSPPVSQFRGITMVICHLSAARLPAPGRDHNLYEDVIEKAKQVFEAEEASGTQDGPQ